MLKKCLLTFLFVLCFAPQMALAQAKIGFFDLQEIIRTSDVGKHSQQKLRRFVESQHALLQSKRNDIEKTQNTLERAQNTNVERQKLQEQLNKQIDEYRNLSTQYRSELQKRDTALTDSITRDVQEIVRGIAQQKKLNFVFETNGCGIVVYPESTDITEDVIKKYNAALISQN